MPFVQRKEREDELEELIESRTSNHDAHQLMRLFQDRGVPAYVVNTAKEVFSDEQIVDRDYWRTMSHEVLGEYRAAAPPFVWSGGDAGPTQSAPLLGEDTHELWTSLLGKSDAEFQELQIAGVLW